jgi:CheY-like chemotaxis protein
VFLLREQGYEVDEADDGLTTLDFLDKKKFDLLTSDVVMPRGARSTSSAEENRRSHPLQL